MGLAIRTLERDDLSPLLALYEHLHRADEPLPSHSQVTALWESMLADPHLFYLGAFSADELVSSCAVALVPNLTRGCRPYAVIENVVTHPEHRQRGYATAVLRRAVERSWERGCYKVMLLTGRRDEETLRFYAAAGFDGERKRAFIAVRDHEIDRGERVEPTGRPRAES